MEVIEFKKEHMKELELQANQEFVGKYDVDYSVLNGYTVINNGTVLLCGGLFKVYSGRYVAWTVWSKHAGKYMRRLFCIIKRYLSLCHNCRIEATCDVNFTNAHQLLKMLGFELEAPIMKRYEVDGRDMSLYALIKE